MTIVAKSNATNALSLAGYSGEGLNGKHGGAMEIASRRSSSSCTWSAARSATRAAT